MGETKPYQPSNGTEGEIFASRFCDRCARDENMDCPILAAVLLIRIDNPNYPKEWVRNVDSEPGLIGGNGARCTAFEKIEEPRT